jgi:uncharacterized protein YoxC
MLALLFLQRAAPADTILALTLPAERTMFDLASGTLQLIVLVLGVVALGALVALLLGVRQTLTRLESQLAILRQDATPLLTRINDVAADARVVSAQLRRDVDRVSTAANRMGDVLDHAAVRTAAHVASIDRTWTSAQDEVEETILAAGSLLRGARAGARSWLGSAGTEGTRRPSRSNHRADRADEADVADEMPRVSRHRQRFRRTRREVPRLRPRDDVDSD